MLPHAWRPSRAILGAIAAGLASFSVIMPARADVGACIAANEQSLSLRRAGKLKDARRQLLICAATACPGELRGECEKRMGGLNAAVPTLVIGAKDGSGNDIAVARVSVDGALVATALDGRPIELDPGEHLVSVAVEGQPVADRKVVLGEGEKNRRETFLIGAAAAPSPVVVVPPASPEARPWGTRQTVSVLAGATGLVGVGVGAAFGVLASSAWSSSKNESNLQTSCTSAANCPAHTTALQQHDTAVTDATVSTVAFGVGAALVVAGVVSWLTAPSRSHGEAPTAGFLIAPSVAPTSAGRGPDGVSLSLVGAF